MNNFKSIKIGLLFLSIILQMISCSKEKSSESEIKQIIYSKASLKVDSVPLTDSTFRKEVEIIIGNENVLMYRKYEDYGQEGGGEVIYLEFDGAILDFSFTNTDSNAVEVYSFGLGLEMTVEGLVSEYQIDGEFANGEWEISGNVGNTDISGLFESQEFE